VDFNITILMNSKTDITRRIKILLEDVLNEFEEINQYNFDEKFNQARNKMIMAKKLRNEIINSNNKDDISFIKQTIEPVAKQISKRYDNVVEEFNLAANAVLKELFIIKNKKKLTIYHR